MPVHEAVETSPHLAIVRAEAGAAKGSHPACGRVALTGEPVSVESAKFSPCLETFKVIDRLMAEFFNIGKFALDEKGKTQIPGRSEAARIGHHDR
jgi:hypothetical protein